MFFIFLSGKMVRLINKQMCNSVVRKDPRECRECRDFDTVFEIPTETVFVEN